MTAFPKSKMTKNDLDQNDHDLQTVLTHQKDGTCMEKSSRAQIEPGSRTYQLPSTQLSFLCTWSQRGRKYVG